MVSSNIKHTPNAPDVRRKLFTCEWSPEEFGQMSSEEMYPELKQREKEAIVEENRLTQYFIDKKLSVDSFLYVRKMQKQQSRAYTNDRQDPPTSR